MATARELALKLPTWGGKRPGAGRKPKGPRAGVPHLRRPALAPRFPVHVTLRARPEVANLRRGKCFRVINRAFGAGKERFGFRLVHFSVQGNHLHLLVEAEDATALARGIKSLSVRIAHGLNRLLGRRGQVFADRYHARILRSPTEVSRALAYVLGNLEKHAAVRGERFPAGFRDPCSSAMYLHIEVGPEPGDPPVARPRTWLLRAGWLRGPPLSREG